MTKIEKSPDAADGAFEESDGLGIVDSGQNLKHKK